MEIQNSQNNLEKEHSWKTHTHDLKMSHKAKKTKTKAKRTSYKAMVIKIMWYQHKDINVIQFRVQKQIHISMEN